MRLAIVRAGAGLIAAVLPMCAVTAAGAQDTSRATVAMKKGDIVEGIFRGATASEVSIEIAGQVLKVPVGELRYVSFVGRVDSTVVSEGSANKPTAGSLEDAYAALGELQGAVRVGVLRALYSEKIVEKLPRVLAYLDANAGVNTDLVTALRGAVRSYQAPLGETIAFNGKVYHDPWEEAPASWATATEYVDYAKQMAKEAPPHEEVAGIQPLLLGQEVKGRLGYGDQIPDSGGGVADVFELKLTSKTKILLTAASAPFKASMEIIDSAGKRKADGRSQIKKTLDAGVYRIWVQGDVGLYSLKASIQP